MSQIESDQLSDGRRDTDDARFHRRRVLVAPFVP
jgi:hypothetical protein